MSKDEIPQEVWGEMQKRLGYTDEEMGLFKADPRNAKVLRTGVEMAGKTIVFEVVESRGCNSGHTVGTRFYFTGDGNLLSKMSPSKVCAYALPIMTQAIFAIQELWYAGVDPNDLRFKRAGCFDVGVACGGWGHIIIEAKVLDRKDAMDLYRAGE